MPTTWPVASDRNPAPKPDTGRPSVNNSAAPRATLIIPSVMMNGGNLPKAMPTPLASPQIAPVPSAATAAIGTGQSAFNASANTTPATARSEPTDRSIPPEMIT